MPILKLDNVGKSFTVRRGKIQDEVHALAGIDLDVDYGEFCVIIGPSGCGKSTLLRIVDGLLDATSGRVLLHDRPIEGPGPDRGFVFQHSNLLPWRTVQKNIEFGLECNQVPAAERSERAQYYLNLVGLKGFDAYYPSQLSGGMQQRVGLARAFAIEPEIMLLDEPFGALDAQTRVLLQAELERIWAVDQRTSVLVTHDIEEAVYLGDRVVVMSRAPGEISQVVDVPFPRPRTESMRVDPEFAALKARLWDALKDPKATTA